MKWGLVRMINGKREGGDMLIPGLVSVTFRKLTRAEIAGLMVNSGLSAIEWGGDVHVPSFNQAVPREEVENAIQEAVYYSSSSKFYIASYGSYSRCEPLERLFNDACIAISMEAPNIRVWAGQRGSADADEEYRRMIAANLGRVCEYVKPRGMTVSVEFHGGTLTDDYKSAVRLVEEVGYENFCLYWQPNQFRDEDYNIAALQAVLPYLSNVHVFTWEGHNKYPLADGEVKWRRYLDMIRNYGGNHHMLLEFVCDDTIEQFYRDAETLLKWIEK